ncbi:MAG: hypothetical protein Q8K34_20420, partial [Hydrogenophaga sp.]|nr:hypothetical protein [Hydrogenophaga sp.]
LWIEPMQGLHNRYAVQLHRIVVKIGRTGIGAFPRNPSAFTARGEPEGLPTQRSVDHIRERETMNKTIALNCGPARQR